MATKSKAGRKANKKPSVAQPDKRANGAPFNEQDPKRRLGNFAGAGEHPRRGSRTAGIIGQTKQKSRTDKSKKK